ncbi:LADA_0B00562g1_1 [Lachancea dasiensis]|uniref:Ubiquitin-like modifier-activating enzyme ATG7 n=1 Tax=Lachancea dasiensis TaxID=1072105 RepID=A0A1G4IRX8_9SACH|nr:LADA_0B00562g1_1 [Lachancea dasiensis]
MSEATMKFGTPFQSFLDTSFFQELARLKLDVLKLDASTKSLGSYVDMNHIPKGSPCAHLFLNDQSFSGFPAKEEGISINGSLYNYNTIEEFKKVEKTQFLYDRAEEAWNAGLENPDNCVVLSVISFADLKSYKFFYWVCVPCFQPAWLHIESLKTGQLSDWKIYNSWFKSHPDSWTCVGDASSGLFQFSKDRAATCTLLAIRDTCKIDMVPSAIVKNFISLLKYFNSDLNKLRLVLVRSDAQSSFWIDVALRSDSSTKSAALKVTGWERNSQNKLTPRATDLSSLIDPLQLADQSLDLNLKLMKWRIAPQIELEVIKNTKVLILGAGTLGCYVSRVLLAWGVRQITFVDNGTVSYSNPVRQPLFNFDSCGKPKAAAAAEALSQIFPLVKSTGIELQVPMIGHPVTNEAKEKQDFDKLVELVQAHDVIFLLMDSRETRWLPSVLGCAENKIVINAALGFDSYLVMRHGSYMADEEEARLGCYFCQDVVAPSDSLTDRTLDQMCTVTRPGVALMAASQSVELLISILQNPTFNTNSTDVKTVLGDFPHQIRGFLNEFKTLQLQSPAFKHCSACSPSVIEQYKKRGWSLVKDALNNYKYIEDLCGLTEVQTQAEEALSHVLDEWDDEGVDEEVLL